MVDRLFSDSGLAALYDVFSPADQRDDLAFYLPLVMSAGAVLDVGCGTGALLHKARESGHVGRLCGVDPAVGMLDVARGRADVEWILGDLDSAGWDSEFDLIVMTGHTFQVFLADEELRNALATIARALTENGRFVFETRNPTARGWETWPSRYSGEVADASGAVVRSVCAVAPVPVGSDRVSFTHTFTSAEWDQPQVSHSTLRFLDQGALSEFLSDAGLVAEEQFGNWDRSSLTDLSPEIITVARRRPS